MWLRYLDQECCSGEGYVVFPEGASSLRYGDPGGLSLTDFGMAVTALRLDVDKREEMPSRKLGGVQPDLVVIRGCTIIATLHLGEIPVAIAGSTISGTGAYGSSPRSPFPVYFYNPPRQNLSFAVRRTLPTPLKMRFWWERLSPETRTSE